MFLKDTIKRFTAIALTVISCASVSSFNANAAEAHDTLYQCTSPIGAWLRSEPSTATDDNKICIINNNEFILVNNVVDGWGQIEYTDPSTNSTVIGWTSLDFYQVFDLSECLIYNLVGDKCVPVNKQKDTNTAPPSTQPATGSFNRDTIYTYLVNDLGLNKASATAVVTNIDCESAFNPTAETIDTNGLTSFGICQWNGPRYESLLSYCITNDLNPYGLESQLKYLKWELNNTHNTQYKTMKTFDNNAQGAYDASYYWASKFEVCSEDYWIPRALKAYDNYNKN